MTADRLFDDDYNPTVGMVRNTDLDTAHTAAVQSLSTVHANRLLILQLLVDHDWLTMFCPLVLTGEHRYKQTSIGPRFHKLAEQGLIERIESRRPRAGAETSNIVSAYIITAAGRRYLDEHNT